MDEDSVQVVPCFDLIEHDQDEDCVCGPRANMITDENGETFWMYTHHSLDGRELAE